LEGDLDTLRHQNERLSESIELANTSKLVLELSLVALKKELFKCHRENDDKCSSLASSVHALKGLNRDLNSRMSDQFKKHEEQV